jgi:hypothetical protein
MQAMATSHVRRRIATVAVLGMLAAFVIVSLIAGYLDSRAPHRWGAGVAQPSGQTAVINSHLTADEVIRIDRVTRQGVAAGLMPGDTLDLRHRSVADRLTFDFPPRHNPPRITVQRDGRTVVVADPPEPFPSLADYSRISDITMRVLLLCAGLLITRYGHGRAAIAAGVYLSAAAMASSPMMSFAGLPVPVQVAGVAVARGARLLAYAARFAFAMELLRPRPLRAAQVLWFGFGVVFTAIAVVNVGVVEGLLTGTRIVPHRALDAPVAQTIMQLFSLGVFAAAAARAAPVARAALRIILAGTTVTIASYVIQEGFIFTDQMPPGWMFWYFNSALLGVGICYPWAIFGRRIQGVDFIASRGVAYAISIILIVVVINLLESLAEQVASFWMAGLALVYGLPVVLGLSLNWLQGQVTHILQTLLDSDFLRTARVAKTLQAQFTHAEGVGELADLAACIAKPLHARFAAMYSNAHGRFVGVFGQDTATSARTLRVIPRGDPALAAMLEAQAPVPVGEASVLDEGWLFPMILFGRIVGALHCGQRAHDRIYEREDRAVLEELTRELAIAMVCLDPELNVRKLLAMTEEVATT